MAHDFDREIVARVWRNTKHAGFPTAHFGHVSLSLANTSAVPHRKTYISWWPGNGACKLNAFCSQPGDWMDDHRQDAVSEMSGKTRDRLQAGQFQPRVGQAQMNVQTVNGPATMWGQKPDAKVRIPGLGAAQGASRAYFGLSMKGMDAWWNNFRLNSQYQLASKTRSCAGAVICALKEGGGEALSPAPDAMVYLTPRNAELWAHMLRYRCDDLNAAGDVLARDFNTMGRNGRFGAGVPLPLPVADLWSVADWNRQSAVANGARNNTLRAIDSALESYHRAGADWDTHFVPKYTALVAVMNHVVKHRREEPNGPQSPAVVRLGKQVLDVVAKRQ